MHQFKAVGILAVLIGVVLQINALPSSGGNPNKAINELKSAFEAFLQNEGSNQTSGMDHDLFKQDKVKEEEQDSDHSDNEELIKQELFEAETEEVAEIESLRYRIRGGRSASNGRVEVYYRNQWGTICDDGFGLTEGRVLCHSLGFRRVIQVYHNSYRYFGSAPTSYPIWLDDVDCRGDESELAQCAHLKFGSHNCRHHEDVGVYCGY